MARFLLAALALVFTEASAQTVINFDDGSAYTLTDDQEIYISTPARALFSRQVMSNKDTFFRVQLPWVTRDYVPTPADDYEIGSHAWCSAFIPWSEGLTFDQVTWDRYCDTNDDGVYDENDDRWV